jgi:hypothetical protein
MLTFAFTLSIATSATVAAQGISAEQPRILNEKSLSFVIDEAFAVFDLTQQPITIRRLFGIDRSLAVSELSQGNRFVLINPHRLLFEEFGFVDTGEFLATTLQLSRRREAKAAINASTVQVSEHGYIALMSPGIPTEGVIVAGVSTAASDPQHKILLDLMSDGLVRFAIGTSELGQLTGVDAEAVAKASSETEVASGQMLINARSAAAIQRSVVNSGNVLAARRLVARNGSIRLEGESPVQASAKPHATWPSPQDAQDKSPTERVPPQNVSEEPAKAAAILTLPSPGGHPNEASVPDALSKRRDSAGLVEHEPHRSSPILSSKAKPVEPSLRPPRHVETKSNSTGNMKSKKSSHGARARQPQPQPLTAGQGVLPEWMKYLPKSESLSEGPAVP